ncbi:MAG: hypothetical protein ABSE59_07145 [Opitutaceae bacterium]|jgi:hypothetical protein
MDDPATKENPTSDFNKLDLSQLQSFSFGTQWTQDKTDPADRAGSRNRRDDRPPREGGDRRPDSHDGGAAHRDRRAFRKPAAAPVPAASPAGGEPPASANRPVRREQDPRGGPRQYPPRRAQEAPRLPYESPYLNVAFYPEDTSFSALAKTIRASCRTLELFDIARTILAKNERFVAVVQRKPAAADGAPAVKLSPFYISVPDGLPFETEDAVVDHVLEKHLDKFFDRAEIEIDPPKGNFQVINRCTLTGELLGPPNYHRYTQIVLQHHAATAARMPFDRFRERIESVRDPELINQWLEKMKKATRYTWKAGSPAEPAKSSSMPAVAADATQPAVTVADAKPQVSSVQPPVSEPSAPAVIAEETKKPEPVAETSGIAPQAPSVEIPAGQAPSAPAFDTIEEARTYLLSHAPEKVFRAVDPVRFPGKLLEMIAPGEIRRAVEGHLERQRRFPLDTANGLRGRLRRESFTIFKKGSKGVSYVCAVKRRFRVPGQVFAESIGTLIAFIEAHPMVRASELPERFLGLGPISSLQGSPTETTSGEIPALPVPSLTPEQRGQLARLQGDLRWLVTEGYVTEFIDGRLFAPPPIAEAKKKEAEAAEHDPENFPEPAAAERTSDEPTPTEVSGRKPDDESTAEIRPETTGDTVPGATQVEPVAPVTESEPPKPADATGSAI